MPRARHVWLWILLTTFVWPVVAQASLQSYVVKWAKLKGIASLAGERRLHKIAIANSEALAELGDAAPTGVASYLRFLLEKGGVKDAVVQGVVRRLGTGGNATPVLKRLLDRKAATSKFSHFGVGQSMDGKVLTLILVRRVVDVAIRRRQHSLQICVRLGGGSSPTVHSPRVHLTLPNARHIERRIRRSRCVTIPSRSKGRYQVEVMVEGQYGPEVAALFPFYVGVPPPDRPTLKVYPHKTVKRGHVEIRLMGLVNRSRLAAGLGPLSPSKMLASVARSHSQDMLLKGFFGHISPTTGDLAHRLTRSRVPYQQASENLALAARPRQAHDSLMASPSHRRTLLDQRATHVGVGVATDPARGLLYVTQIVARLQRGTRRPLKPPRMPLPEL